MTIGPWCFCPSSGDASLHILHRHSRVGTHSLVARLSRDLHHTIQTRSHGICKATEPTQSYMQVFCGCHNDMRNLYTYMVVSLNYCSQNGGNLSRAPYYNGNPNIGPRITGNLDQYPKGPVCDYLRPSSIPCLCLDQSKQPCGANVIENAVQQHEAGAL